MIRLALTALASAGLLLTPSPQGEDLLLLKDGRIFLDVELDRAEDGGLVVRFENGDVPVPEHLIQDALIMGEALPEPRSAEEREQFAEGKVKFDGKWVTLAKRDQLMEKAIKERREELLEIEARRLWRNRHEEDTKHFSFETTAPPQVFELYRDQLEAYFTVFAKDWKVRPPKENPRLKVCLHVSQEDFLQVTGVPRGVLGYFRFVNPMELNFFYIRQDPVFTSEVLFHEANHYMQKLLDVEFKMPHFPGEAIAEFYGGASWDPDKKKLTVGQVLPSRLVEVKTDIDGGKRWGLEELITTDGAYEHYTWGWTLVHFLMNDSKHKKGFQKFVNELVSGRKVKRESMSLGAISLRTVRPQEVWATFRRTMGLKKDEQVMELEHAWHRYIDEELVVEGVRAKLEAAQKALQVDRTIRAKRLLTEAIDEGCEDPLAFLELGKLLYYDGDRNRAAELFEKAVAADPLDAEYRVWYGRSLRRIGQEDDGKIQIGLASEIGSNDPSVRWLLEQEEDD